MFICQFQMVSKSENREIAFIIKQQTVLYYRSVLSQSYCLCLESSQELNYNHKISFTTHVYS